MKKFKSLLLIIFSLLLLNLNPSKIYSQTSNNVVLEYCTGAWCGFCPCGHEILDQILINYPNTVVLSYSWL